MWHLQIVVVVSGGGLLDGALSRNDVTNQTGDFKVLDLAELFEDRNQF